MVCGSVVLKSGGGVMPQKLCQVDSMTIRKSSNPMNLLHL